MHDVFFVLLIPRVVIIEPLFDGFFLKNFRFKKKQTNMRVDPRLFFKKFNKPLPQSPLDPGQKATKIV